MKIYLVAVLFFVTGFVLPSTFAFASSTKDAYQHTYYHIINNTGMPLYISNPDLGGTWNERIPMQTAMQISAGSYNNVLTSLVIPYNNEEEGQADVEVCTNPLMHDGKAYCEVSNNFCTLYTDLDSKFTPHHVVNVNKQSGTLSCNAEKQITADGMVATFTINQS